MFSDAALAMVVDTSTKWLYNASRRLGRPLERSFEDASWWRMTHHLAGRLGIPLADAARASDLLLRPGLESTKVRLRSTMDDAVSISVDLARFHDGASLAAAAGLYLAIPRRRGRPPRSRGAGARPDAPTRRALRSEELVDHLSRALASVRTGGEAEAGNPVAGILVALAEASVPIVIAGDVARVFHGDSPSAPSLDLIADLSSRHPRSLGSVLNSLGAVPRGVTIREAFRFDPSLIRAAPCLALRIQGVSVNILRILPGIGEFPQVAEASVSAPLDERTFRVLSRESLARVSATLARVGSPA